MYIILYLFLLYISTLWTLHTPRFRHSAFPCFPPNQIIGRKMFCLSVTEKRANISVAFCHKCGFEARILCLTLRKYLEELLLKKVLSILQSSFCCLAKSRSLNLLPLSKRKYSVSQSSQSTLNLLWSKFQTFEMSFTRTVKSSFFNTFNLYEQPLSVPFVKEARTNNSLRQTSVISAHLITFEVPLMSELHNSIHSCTISRTWYL